MSANPLVIKTDMTCKSVSLGRVSLHQHVLALSVTVISVYLSCWMIHENMRLPAISYQM